MKTLNELRKGDIVYVLNQQDFSVKESPVIEIDKDFIYTPYKDFSFFKLGKLIHREFCIDKDMYFATSKECIVGELNFLKQRNENDKAETSLILKSLDKDRDYIENFDEELKKCEEQHARAVNNLTLINASLSALK